MITDQQYTRLLEERRKGRSITVSAMKTGMHRETAAKYLERGKAPSEQSEPRTYRTREDPFVEVWPECEAILREAPWFQGTELFAFLNEKYPGRFAEGQLRTLQRKVRSWRATEGRPKTVMFTQVHEPGALGESDFTSMNDLGVTIGRVPFDHLLYHFVLTYSNHEYASVVMSETFEALAGGLGRALFECGGAPGKHRIDRMSAAVKKLESNAEFTARYADLLAHYGMEGQMIQTGEPHENGDIESRHGKFKSMVRHALFLRGSLDFSTREEYESFIRSLAHKANMARLEKFEEEAKRLRPLPPERYIDHQMVRLRVGPSSTINVRENTYSVDSRLIREYVDVRLHAEHLEIWHGQKKVDAFPRLRGKKGHRIQYRHIIDSLVRKPGAFEGYRYREDLFPTTTFRMAYDRLRSEKPERGTKEYLQLLRLAARTNETKVDEALRKLIDDGQSITLESVKVLSEAADEKPRIPVVKIERDDPEEYDRLFTFSDLPEPNILQAILPEAIEPGEAIHL